jgi:hypothetical protein
VGELIRKPGAEEKRVKLTGCWLSFFEALKDKLFSSGIPPYGECFHISPLKAFILTGFT